jgi:transposase
MYAAFCARYRAWRGHLDVVMRQTHLAGDKLFVDYAGHTMPVIDRTTGEVRQVQIFVAVLGASNYTYAEATWTQSLPDWIGAHTRAFAFLGGVPNIVIPDNLKSGVTRAHRYDPDLNPTYQDMAAHYGVAVVPTRVRKPQDKAKVEVGVQIVERTLLAVLRNRQFFSLAELNDAIAELLSRLNQRPFKKLPGSRHSQFDALDRPTLKPLPTSRALRQLSCRAPGRLQL